MTFYNFGSRELCKCLVKLSFWENPQRGSSHTKFTLKQSKIKGVRPFIIVIMGRKKYDPHTARSYIRQIKNLGSSEEEIEKNL
ncbi:hypothetical protein A2125_00500 [Candidatus Woesebacteria bacterium GWB1_43_5]|uniref:Uncharacterized protein n=1 Tax=Candidatus Woesebacteria bacterium GWB1_43_5 TaxID=1802474 RepID=A0A1F7WRJ8_9BACT|nr:MAG: hypothetical protein A2125_00500 [Candidatus Woesebacteria bacterium GWB1_43_5]